MALSRPPAAPTVFAASCPLAIPASARPAFSSASARARLPPEKAPDSQKPSAIRAAIAIAAPTHLGSPITRESSPTPASASSKGRARR